MAEKNEGPFNGSWSSNTSISKTIDILGIGKKVASPYKFTNDEQTYQELAKRAFDRRRWSDESQSKPKRMVAAAGSSEVGVAPLGDRGFLSAIVHSYNNHYILQTTPEDWWYTIISKLATAIEEATNDDEDVDQVDSRAWYRTSTPPEARQKLREFFVRHEGKKSLTVFVPPGPLHEQNYSIIFSQFTEQITANTKVPQFAETVRADFSTSTPTHVIESEITLMSAMKNYFEYKMHFLCGIPQIEMMGTEADWRKLKSKFIALREILAPVKMHLVEPRIWWEKVEVILQKLIDTYMGKPDLKWWSHIFNKKDPWGSGPSYTVLKGWFIEDFLNGRDVELFEDIVPSGLTTCPLILEGAGYPTPVNATLVAGIAGIQVDDSHEPVGDSSILGKVRALTNGNRRSSDKVPKVRALHGWALFLDETDAPKKGKITAGDDEGKKRLMMEKKLESEYTSQWKENSMGEKMFF